MNKVSVSALALAALLAAPVFAQSTAPAAAPAAASADLIVQGRAEQRAAHSAYLQGKKALQAERDAKITAAMDAAAKDATGKGKDPLVAKRDAKAKATQATKADYDAKLKSLADERKKGLASADKKFKAAKSAG
jgi:hypothetical protein